MDYDGRRVRRLTTTGTINLSPTWSPDGNELAFTSWRGRQPGGKRAITGGGGWTSAILLHQIIPIRSVTP